MTNDVESAVLPETIHSTHKSFTAYSCTEGDIDDSSTHDKLYGVYREFPVASCHFVRMVGPLGCLGPFRSLDANDVRDVVTHIDRFVQLQHGQSDL